METDEGDQPNDNQMLDPQGAGTTGIPLKPTSPYVEMLQYVKIVLILESSSLLKRLHTPASGNMESQKETRPNGNQVTATSGMEPTGIPQ